MESDTIAADLDFVVGDSTVYIEEETVSSIVQVSSQQHSQVIVFPNPFIDVTTLSYALLHDEQVSVEIYNVLGEQVYVESFGNLLPGKYTTVVGDRQIGSESGIYFVKLNIGEEVHTIRIVKSN